MAVDEKLHHPRRDLFRQLRAFCYAARLKSMSRAAERVFSSQPAVSQQVSDLEKELAVTLFERKGPNIALTPAGKRFYELASSLVARVDRLPDTFAERHHGVSSGALEIAAGQAGMTSVLPGHLREFRERHPDVRVNMQIGGINQRLRWLRAYEVDIAFTMGFPPLRPDLDFHPICSSDMVFITPEDHRLAGRKRVDLTEIARWPVVAHPPGHHVSEIVDLTMRRHGQVPNPVLEVRGWDVIKTCVEAGIGIALIPEIYVTEQDRVWKIPARRYFPPQNYGLVTRRDDILSLAAGWFMEIIKSGVPGSSGNGR